MIPQKINCLPETLEDASQSSLLHSVSLMADSLKQVCGNGVVFAHAEIAHAEIAKTALYAALETERLLAEQQERIAHLEKIALTDELTDTLNRRGFLAQLQNTLSSATRYKENGVLVYVDLDGFKPVNDTYGHAAGDEVLRQVARVLHGNIRDCDYVGRLGGDEFAVLLTRSTWEDGLKRAETLERTLNGTFVGWNGRMIALRASFGIQAYGPRDDEHDLLSRADDAMYKTKRLRANLSGERTAA